METLISTDRCDHCGAQAYVQVNKGNKTLMFCGHHFTKHGDALDKNGWNISVDVRDLLTRKAVGTEVK